MNYDMLFSPIKIGNVTVKNRIAMAPMLMDMGQFDGTPTQQLMNYYEERAKGGTGLIFTEITRVDDLTGASAFCQLSMSHDYNIEPMHEMVERIHKHGAKLFVQLHHPGRQNMGLLVGTVPLSITCDKYLSFYKKMLYSIVPAGKVLMSHHIVPKVVAPSKCENSYFSDGNNRGLSEKAVERLVKKFVDAAVRVQKAGCDGVELHASHGYLIQQFLSPNTNHRTDKYGGSLENRMRFLLEIISGIRNQCGKDFPIVVRLTVDEMYEKIGKPNKGYNLKDGIEMAKRLEGAGIDALDVSSAAYDTFNYWLEPTSFECGWRKYLAENIKKVVKIPVIAANLIRSPEQAEKQLEDKVQDMISLGRPHIADPHWAIKVQQGREKEIKRCICCLYCIESMQNNAYVGDHGYCAVNPLVGREDYELKNDGDARKIAVVGSGPAGLTAAELLGKRGFDVTVFEKESVVGGQVVLATKPPHKEKLGWCIEDLEYAAKKAGAKIQLDTTVTKELLEEFKPYAIIVATGGFSVKPKSIEGVGGKNVCTVTEILNKTVNLENKTVAVIGSGMTGLETAELLCEKGNSVTVVEMADSVAPGAWMQHRDDIMPRLLKFGTDFMLSQKLVAIREDHIRIENTKTAEQKSVNADYVVLSLGVKGENKLFEEIKTSFDNVYLVGDAGKVGRIADATRSAFEAVDKI